MVFWSLDSNIRISFDANLRTLRTNGIKGEVVVTFNFEQYYLWRAVDCEGNVLDVLLQRHCDPQAPKRFFRQLHKKTRLCSTGNRERQTQQLRSSKQASAQERGASKTQAVEQPRHSNSLYSHHSRATNAQIQISREGKLENINLNGVIGNRKAMNLMTWPRTLP